MQSKATTVKAYMDSLPADRKKAIAAVRRVIRDNLDSGFAEGMQYGAIGYFVPHERYPAGYHCDPKQPLPFAGIASQKQYISIYLMSVYSSPAETARFKKDWAKSGKKLDMGKSCVRVKTLDDIALDAIGKAVKRVSAKKYIANYEKGLEGTAAGKKHMALKAKLEAGGVKTKTANKKTAKKKTANKKTAKKKTASKKSATRRARR